jgi:polysaccharide pyruvyl transferase CsaB
MKKSKEKPGKLKIGISGSYGGYNLGDEAILQSILADLRRDFPTEVTVFTRDPEDTLKRHPVERAVSIRELAREEILPEIERLDLFILGGGGILFDGEMQVYLREVEVANESRVPVMAYAIGAGPLSDESNLELLRRELSRVAVITVREKSALKILQEAGIQREIIVTADPAFLLEPEPLPNQTLLREGLADKKHLVGISVREPGKAAPDIDEENYHELLANAADFMIDRFDADVVFVPMEYKILDMQHSHAVIAKMLWPQRATVLKEQYTPGQLLSLIKHFEFAVGMRLHFLLFAALQGVPFVALPYAEKVAGLLEDLGMVSPPMKKVNSGRLIAYIDRFWDMRKTLTKKIKSKTAVMKERAQENQKFSHKIMSDISLRKQNAASQA